MSYCTPSTPIIERPQRVPDRTRTNLCLSCGDTMRHLRTVPRLGVLPELLVFVCPSCKGTETKQVKRVA